MFQANPRQRTQCTLTISMQFNIVDLLREKGGKCPWNRGKVTFLCACECCHILFYQSKKWFHRLKMYCSQSAVLLGGFVFTTPKLKESTIILKVLQVSGSYLG